MKSVTIQALETRSAEIVLEAIRSESSEYLKHFTPYYWEDESFIKAIAKKKEDQFNGIFINDIPVGFYMLRGIDDGYVIPSYSVWISEKTQGLGLASLSLKHAFTVCKLNGIKTMMLKVHPDNTIAKRIYEKFGFKYNRDDHTSEDMIYHIQIH